MCVFFFFFFFFKRSVIRSARAGENEPLIPAHAKFLLTTNAARVRTLGEASEAADGDNESGSQLNTWAYERYFDKPEVIRAYREQQLIQTPEFTLLSEHEAVGGRFRPRSLDDVRAYRASPKKSCSCHLKLTRTLQEGIDTSDGAYEKRHRKYETFEKRQRLREKEKLKHEHYKLKERIEQLRALEPSAFLSASDSFFAGSLHQPPHQGNPDAQGSTTDAPVTAHSEGEWRKRQMLDVANSLDARYRTLLDTVPSRAPDLPAPTPPPPTPAPPVPASPIPASPLSHTPNHIPKATARHSPGPTPGPARTTSPTGQRVPPTPLPPTEVIELDSDGEEATPKFVKAEPMTAQPIPVRHDTTESLKLRIKFRNRQPPALSLSQPPPLSSPSSPRPRIASTSPNPKASASGSPSPSRPRPKPIFKNPAAPSQYVRIPFVKSVLSQDVVGATAVDDATLPSISSSLSPRQTASPALSSNSATHLTLRRRPSRATGHPNAGSPTTGATASVLKQQPPLAHGQKHDTDRLRKRRRVELSDEDEENHRFDNDDGDGDAINGVNDDGREEEGEDDAEGGSEEEWQRAQWRESALYREAQRLAGAPSGRKTHRHLGIFGLKGFPAEIEHLHDFVVPRWALPLGDSRLVEEERRVGTPQGRSSERARRGGGGAGQRRLRDTVTALAGKADGEESASGGKSDPLVAAETASTVDSQV